MLRKLWDSTFHLEGKFIRSCWQLFVPGKVTSEFFKGKQDRYPHPLRMFAIVMFLFLFCVNWVLKQQESSSTGSMFNLTTSVNTSAGDSIVGKKEVSYYETLKYKVMLNDMQEDFEAMPASWKTAATKQALDSLLRKTSKRQGIGDIGTLDSLDLSKDTTTLGLWGANQIRLATLDLVRYSPEELIQRYQVEDWKLKLFLRQTIKSYRNPEGFIHSYLGSLTWAILALVTLMSGVLSLLYWRHKRFYVEHFIFLLHFHTGLMLAMLIGFVGLHFSIWGVWYFVWLFLWSGAFMYLSMRRYYGQSRGKTILKWIAFGLFYYFSFMILLVLGTLTVFALF